MATSEGTGTPALRWDGRSLRLLDQTLLPAEETWIGLEGAADTAAAIARLAVRGAPNIGIAAAYGLAMSIARAPGDDELREAASVLRDARPTAVTAPAGLGAGNCWGPVFGFPSPTNASAAFSQASFTAASAAGRSDDRQCLR